MITAAQVIYVCGTTGMAFSHGPILTPISIWTSTPRKVTMRERIQDFPRGRQPIIQPHFPENCIKMKKIGREGGRIQNFTV